MKQANWIAAAIVIGAGVLLFIFFTSTASDEPQHNDHDAHDEHENDEGRTRISNEAAESSGIRVERAGARTIAEVIELTGTVEADPARVSMIRPRFAGVVTEVHRTVGDAVERGDALATVETNESLMRIPVTAPISGLILGRNVQPGQVTGAEPLFVIADPEVVWVQLDVFGNQADAIRKGQPVELTTLGGRTILAEINWVSPVMAHGSQSLKARVVVPNANLRLRLGQFVRARVLVDEVEVPLAVRLSAVQRYRDSEVVFVRVGDVYEVKRLELGRQDAEYVEVLDGLDEGQMYVAENSYLIKADIEKAGASHSH